MNSYIITNTVIPTYLFEPDEATGNNVFRINRNNCVVEYKKNNFLVPHRRNYYFMIFVKAGSSRHWIDMTPYTVKPNTFYYTVPQQVHLKEESKPFTGISLSFTEEFLAMDDSGSLKKLPIIQGLDNGHELELTEQDQAYIEDLLEKILAEYEAKNSWQQNMLLAYMKVLLIYLSRLHKQQISFAAEQTPPKQVFKNFLSKVDEWHRQLHEVAAYANMLNLSAGHLSELVKEQSGKPAIAHIHERLIVEAKRLLFHTEHSIKEIAFQLGFEDASYFNRFFKRITQHTPITYRNAIREMYH
ncbi:helix-turn-helix transcriptional regulator [Mucilaginibacter lacusdianchii]|uniref:helix-turn-helix transcriptional regulator n=1 Tax=Mucilaginibacter lacusdianchii TaxID=2684211 RepID=UPI00131A6BA2|nr:helix-turn-helix transcriptional regulator [Mucilaginibacter sp. JXJ CY 39]